MLLQSLYQYAQRKKLLDSLPFQMRTVHLLIPVTKDGAMRGSGVVRQFTIVIEKKKEKEVLGREYSLPRFPGENNGGKAYFLAEKCASVLGLDPDTGKALPLKPRNRAEKFPVAAYKHFWARIDEAYAATKDYRLLALKQFRERYLPERGEFVSQQLPFIEARTNEKTDKQEWGARTDSGDWISFAKATTLSFEVDGRFVFQEDPGDPIRDYWISTFLREAEEADRGETINSQKPTVCLVSEQAGKPIARSHKPKILGVPGLAAGGYIVSFAKEAPAFSSFGFEMGENAPVSQEAAASYALALTDLLEQEDSHFRVGETCCFCFWANNAPFAAKLGRLANRPDPKSVREFLGNPFAGVEERRLAHQDHFHSVMLSGNAGRVVVRSWLREPLDEAVDHFAQWFRDLEIVTFSHARDEESDSSPFSLFRLAAATVRDRKELKHKADLVGQLYRAAFERSAPPLALLKPVLSELGCALVRQDPMRPWSNPSRFALLKLILKRHYHPGKEFAPMPHLADTNDPAYNLGRLFAILSRLQDAAHEYQLQGAGVIERYYAGASTAPATVFGMLLRLHNHHLRKLEQQGESGSKAASAIRGKIAEIIGKFTAASGQPPTFPRILNLEEQARFALGFYQQEAAERQAIDEARERKKAAESKTA